MGQSSRRKGLGKGLGLLNTPSQPRGCVGGGGEGWGWRGLSDVKGVISSVSHPCERCQMWLQFLCFSLHPKFSTCCSFLYLLWVPCHSVACPRIPFPGRSVPPQTAGSFQSNLLHDQDRKWDTLQRTDGESQGHRRPCTHRGRGVLF